MQRPPCLFMNTTLTFLLKENKPNQTIKSSGKCSNKCVHQLFNKQLKKRLLLNVKKKQESKKSVSDVKK